MRPDGSFELVEGRLQFVRLNLVPPVPRGARIVTPEMNERKTATPKRGRASDEAYKPDGGEYRDLVARDLSPRLNLRTMEIETSEGVLSEEAFEDLHLSELRKRAIRYRKADLQVTVRALAAERQFDPVAEWLSKLGTSPDAVLSDPEWGAIASLVFGIEGELEREVLQRWLIAAVARPLQPGCKVDYALILHGGQGLFKSSVFAALAGPEWFTDSMGNLENRKDDLQVLHRGWICEWPEADAVFAGAQKAELAKRFISAQADDFRAPYARTTRRWLRRSVMVGTTNRDDWCNDHTGARRYPVLSPQTVNLEWIKTNRERIWGRAVVEFRRGTPWWFAREVEAAITERAKAFGVEDEWEAPLTAFFLGKEGEWFTTREIAAMALNLEMEKVNGQVLRQISRSMQRTFANRARKERRPHNPRKASYGAKGLHSCWSVLIS
jgi:predicted P-loop ATPase